MYISCEGPRCRDKQTRIPQANSGTRLCAACRAHLCDDLALLPDLYRRCEGILVNTRARDVERVHGGLPGGISLNDDAVAIRTEIMTVLASWAGLIVHERRVCRPLRRDINALTDFLAAHLDWLAEHPAAGDAAAEITTLVRPAADAISSDTTVRVELGPCDRTGCGGVVSVTVNGGGTPTPDLMSCDGGHTLQPQEWLMLKYKLERAGHGPSGNGGGA